MPAPGAQTRTRANVMQTVNGVRTAVKDVFVPMLGDASREAIAFVERDETADATLKRSAQRLQIDQAAFAGRVLAAVDREIDIAVNELAAHAAKPEQTNSEPGGLSLIEYGQMEQDMMLDRMASRLRNACDDEFTSLNQRLATAFDLEKFSDRENPFHPMRFCKAVGEALEQTGFLGDDRMTLVKAFDVPLARPLNSLYAELNRRLDKGGIKDGGSAQAFRNTVAGLRRNTVSGTVKFSPDPEQTAAKAEQLLQTLYERMQLLGGAPAAATYPGAAPAATSGAAAAPLGNDPPPGMNRYDTGAGQIGTVAAGQGAVDLGAMAALAQAAQAAGQAALAGAGGDMQLARDAAMGGVSPVAHGFVAGAPMQFTAIDSSLLTSINDIQRLGMLSLMAAAGSGRGVPGPLSADDERNVRTKLAERATRQVDKLTIELVGMLFERILHDKHVPIEIKAVLSRLQFPLLKVALTDSDLFVSPTQPARRLMDRIASTAVGWTPSGEENQRYLAEVNKVVNAVAFAINDGPEVFVTALEGFEKYLNDERVRDDNPFLRAKRALEEAETREIMAINATIGVRKAFEGVQIESYLRDFLLDTWITVLVAATLADGKGDELIKRYRAVVPDLVWSVQPKLNIEDRKRLVKIIPGVLKGIREGFELIKLPLAQTQDFFTKLMNSHAQAVKALETAYGNAPATPLDAELLKQRIDAVKIEAPAAQIDDQPIAISKSVVANAIEANHAELALLDPATVAPENLISLEDLSEQRLDRMIDSWQRGAWFELWTRDGTERVHLQWVSPRRTFYLFASPQSGRVYSLPPEALRSYVRANRLRPLESASLFDRAVGEMMRDLNGKEAGSAA